MAVLLHHATAFVMPSLPGVIGNHGPEAVAIFFVLSGLVIGHVTTDKGERDWQSYALARISRLASVIVVALPVVVVADRCGMMVNPAAYAGMPWFAPVSALSVVRALTFTNELWFSHAIFGSDEPYWSLGFEAPYYLLFGLAFFLRGPQRLLAIALWMLVFGIKIAAFLPLWLLGLATLTWLKRSSTSRWLGTTLLLGSVLGYGLARVAKHHVLGGYHLRMFAPENSADFGYAVIYFLIVASLIAVHIVGFAMSPLARIEIGARLERGVRWLAGGSFTLYLVHMPLLVLASALWPDVIHRPAEGVLVIVGVVLVCYALAELGERRKRGVRSIVQRLLFPKWPAPEPGFETSRKT